MMYACLQFMSRQCMAIHFWKDIIAFKYIYSIIYMYVRCQCAIIIIINVFELPNSFETESRSLELDIKCFYCICFKPVISVLLQLVGFFFCPVVFSHGKVTWLITENK